jgi:hypothetical protein
LGVARVLVTDIETFRLCPTARSVELIEVDNLSPLEARVEEGEGGLKRGTFEKL